MTQKNFLKFFVFLNKLMFYQINNSKQKVPCMFVILYFMGSKMFSDMFKNISVADITTSQRLF